MRRAAAPLADLAAPLTWAATGHGATIPVTTTLAAGGAGEDGNESGDLDTGPFNELRVAGRGMGATVVGGAGDRLLDVAGASLGLADLTVRDGIAPGGQSGGAIRSRGVLTVLRVAFVNTAAGDGDEPTGRSP